MEAVVVSSAANPTEREIMIVRSGDVTRLERVLGTIFVKRGLSIFERKLNALELSEYCRKNKLLGEAFAVDRMLTGIKDLQGLRVIELYASPETMEAVEGFMHKGVWKQLEKNKRGKKTKVDGSDLEFLANCNKY